MSLTATTILTAPAQARHEVKRSIFDAFAEPFEDPSSLEALLKRHWDTDARHHCWAWRCNGDYRFNDAGEPAGTAGRPILQAVEGAGLDRTLVVVRRYFGGIKLGAGGLVRAYSAATSACLQQARTRVLVPHVELHLEAPFQHTQALFQALSAFGSSRPVHTPAGIRLSVKIPSEQKDVVESELRSQTRGEISIKPGAEFLA